MEEEKVINLVNFNAGAKAIQKSNNQIKMIQNSKLAKTKKQKEQLYVVIFFLLIAVYIMLMILAKVIR